MATTIITKYGSGAPAASDVVRGELAVDTENGRLYTENIAGSVVEIGLNPSGDLDVTGTVTADGLTVDGTATITTADNTTQLTLKSTDTDASVGPVLDLHRDSSSPADNDYVGEIRFRGENDASEIINYAGLASRIIDVTDGTEDGRFELYTSLNGAQISRVLADATETVINQDSADLDFRVESNNNANMLFVDAGNDAIGIGNSNPGGYSGDGRDLVIGTTSGDNGLSIISGTSGTGNIYFGDVEETGTGSRRGQIVYDHATDHMRFATAATEAMRIDSSGRVGIGTASPNQIMTLDKASGDIFTRFDKSGAIKGLIGVADSAAAGSSASVQGDMIVRGQSRLLLDTVGTTALTIDSSQNVGISTTSPANGVSYNAATRVLGIAGSGAATSAGYGAISLTNNRATPSGSDDLGKISFGSSNDTGPEKAYIYASAVGSGGATGGYGANMIFATRTDNGGLSNNMTLDSSGNLLVGTTNANPTSSAVNDPGVELSDTGGVRSTVASNPAATFNRKTDDGDVVIFRKNGTTVGSIGAYLGSPYIGTGDTGLLFETTNNRIEPFDTSALGAEDAAIDLGQQFNRFKDLYLSGGVYVGGTAAANHLDDYEEGTWTPVITDALGGTYTGTYAGRNGRYTKIGRLVQVTFEMYVGSVDLTANGLTGSSAVVISGFPFTSNSQNFTGGTVSNANGINYSGEQILCKIGRSADRVSIATLSSSTGSNESEVTVTEFNNGSRLVYATIQYEAA